MYIFDFFRNKLTCSSESIVFPLVVSIDIYIFMMDEKSFWKWEQINFLNEFHIFISWILICLCPGLLLVSFLTLCTFIELFSMGNLTRIEVHLCNILSPEAPHLSLASYNWSLVSVSQIVFSIYGSIWVMFFLDALCLSHFCFSFDSCQCCRI